MSRIEFLAQEILRHKELYYKGKAEIADESYDQLEQELKNLDPNHWVLNFVGHQLKTEKNIENKKVAHDKKMLSLEKTYEVRDLIKWKSTHELMALYKMDGSSCSLIYQAGEFILAKTRGDGSVGENITDKISYIGSIPKKIISHQEDFEVRGEICCDEESFIKIKEEMNRLNLDSPTSQRNIVAGLLHRKDHLYLCHHLTFFGFEVLSNNKIFSTEEEKLKFIQKINFKTPIAKLIKNEKDLLNSIEEIKEYMNDGEYLVDGIVYTFNDTKLHQELGYTGHHPKYRLSFKFSGEVKETKINDIEWNVSRNGLLTPVANVEPVELSGAIISRVTLHNYGQVHSQNLKAGDIIEIIRSGEVIPKLLSVKVSTPGEMLIPKTCPSCKGDLDVSDIWLVCNNRLCPSQIIESIIYFVSVIDIQDLSEKRIKEMLDKKLITNVSSLFLLTESDLMKMEKVKEKLSQKIVMNIQSKKKIPLDIFLTALGLEGGAINKCQKIIEAGYNTLEKILNLKNEDLEAVDSFAKKSADNFLTSLHHKKDMINSLLKVGVQIINAKEKVILSDQLIGKKFCLTGALSQDRKTIEELLKSHGAEIVNTVSKKTNYVLTNDVDSQSSKFIKAKELKIPIINEDELNVMLNKEK